MISRLLTSGLVLAAAFGLAAAAPGGPAHPTCAQAAGEHHVAIVVEHGSGATLSRCVAFTGDSIVAETAMSQSGIEYRTSGFGGYGDAVCQVDYEPQTYPAGCWTSTSPYWAMFVAHGVGAWAVSQRGVSSLYLQDGDALGWHYVPQSGPGGGPPPSPAGVCAAAAAPPPAAAAPPVAGPPAPAAAAPVAPSAVSTPAPAGAPAADQGPLTASPAGRGSQSTATRARRSPPAQGIDLGLLAASLAGGALTGLLVLQLVAARLRS